MTAAETIITLELGQYRLREQIAASAYGLVWRASGPRGTPDVALKLINRDKMEAAAPQLRARWSDCARNEIAFLQSLEPWDERHIVRLLDSGWHDGLPVLALELMETDLGKHMAARKASAAPLPLARILDWLGQVNQALAKVHQYGWRHLDLKPSNLLLDPQLNTVKLADFGTNRQLDDLQAHSYTGTANWQAPEQFFPGAGGGYLTDARSDYFALGALFYFLVCGGTPLRYCSDCAQAYREGQQDGAAALLAAHGGAIPPILQADEAQQFGERIARERPAAREPALALLRALLAPLPQQRPRHAIQISRMLDATHGTLATRNHPELEELVRGMARPSAANGWRHMQGLL